MLSNFWTWFYDLFASIQPKPPPMPGQTWYVAGIGRCVVHNVFCNQSFLNELEWAVNYISYQPCDGGLVSTVKRTTFLTNSKLVTDEEWSDFVKYKSWLKENKIH